MIANIVIVSTFKVCQRPNDTLYKFYYTNILRQFSCTQKKNIETKKLSHSKIKIKHSFVLFFFHISITLSFTLSFSHFHLFTITLEHSTEEKKNLLKLDNELINIL